MNNNQQSQGRRYPNGLLLYSIFGIGLAFLWLITCAIASTGNGKYMLPWGNPAEKLLYHSCGCGDACWVAEVKSKKTNFTQATLKCDCENMYFSTKKTKEKMLTDLSCSKFETNEKPRLIRLELERLYVHKT
jgi:hypothetical protein